VRVTQMGMGVVTVAAQRSNFSVNESNHRLDELQSALARRSPLWANADSAAARIETRTSPRAIRAARPARYDPVVATQGAAGPDPRTVLAASEPRLAVFAPENLLTRLIVVLDAEAQVFQLGINLDAVGLTASTHPNRQAPNDRCWPLRPGRNSGPRPSTFDTARLDRTGGMDCANRDPVAEIGRYAPAAGLQTASLDEVLSHHPV